jgi:hypothetical protein
MIKQASNARQHLRRFLTADPGRFAGGSAVSGPLGLLAVERERLAALRSPQHDGSPQSAATVNHRTMTIAGDGRGRSLGRIVTAIKNLDPGYFAFVMATSIISTGTFLLGPSWLSRALLVVLGFWRHVRHHWPLSYEPALWSVVFPRGMYSVATLTFGKVAHLAFMEPLSRFTLWVALAAWVAVAAAWVAVAAAFVAAAPGGRQPAGAGSS